MCRIKTEGKCMDDNACMLERSKELRNLSKIINALSDNIIKVNNTAVEARKSTNDILDNISETLREHKKLIDNNELVIETAISSIENNSTSIKLLTEKTIEISNDVKPINEGVQHIKDSIKVLAWISNIVKWLSATLIGTGLIIYGWTEHVFYLFTGKNY